MWASVRSRLGRRYSLRSVAVERQCGHRPDLDDVLGPRRAESTTVAPSNFSLESSSVVRHGPSSRESRPPPHTGGGSLCAGVHRSAPRVLEAWWCSGINLGMGYCLSAWFVRRRPQSRVARARRDIIKGMVSINKFAATLAWYISIGSKSSLGIGRMAPRRRSAAKKTGAPPLSASWLEKTPLRPSDPRCVHEIRSGSG
jgi:hypothetical protein